MSLAKVSEKFLNNNLLSLLFLIAECLKAHILAMSQEEEDTRDQSWPAERERERDPMPGQ